MELLAVGGLAYLGTILNNSVLGEYDKISQAKSMKKPSKSIKQTKSKSNSDKKSGNVEKFNFFNKSGYVKPELDEIEKKYKRRANIMKKNSFVPEKSRVIPSFYNQIPGVGEDYTVNKFAIPGKLETGKIRDNMNIINEQFALGPLKKGDPAGFGNELEVNDNWTEFKEGGDMTYGLFKSEELQHNNMQPFFRMRDFPAGKPDTTGSGFDKNSPNNPDNVEFFSNNAFGSGKMTEEINSNNTLMKMELFTGSSKNYFPKEAPPPFFEPMKDVHFNNGKPNQTDKFQERMIPGNLRQGELPFQPIRVNPGLALGYDEESKIGFHDPYRPPKPTIDTQRVGNRIQKTNAGVVIPGQKGQKQPVDPNVAKRRPEKAFDVQEYMHGGSAVSGGVTKPAVNPAQILKDQTRKVTSELKNGLSMASGSLVGPFNPGGTQHPTFRKQFEGFEPVGPSQQSVNNNNLKSYNILENQRTETGTVYYDGVPSNREMNKVASFNTQPTNTTMRQTTAETAQDGVAFGPDMRKVNVFNTQPTNTTMRQTTAETAQDGIAYGPDVRKNNVFNTQPANTTMRQTTAEMPQENPAYGPDNRRSNLFNTQPTNVTMRQTTAETANDGFAKSNVGKTNVYNTQPTNTTLRQTTAETANEGFAAPNNGKVHQYNTQPTNTTLRQTTAEPANDGFAKSNVGKTNLYNTQPTNTTLRQTTAETANDGFAKSNVGKTNVYNTQPTNTTLRQTTAETANEGFAAPNNGKVHQFNTQPTNTTLRQTTAETANEGFTAPNFGLVHSYNTQPTNTTLRQTTAETANEGFAKPNIGKTNTYNTQPTNTTLRQTTAETANEGFTQANVGKVHQFNTQAANTTLRQTTAETAQENAAYGPDNRRGNLFNTQPTNTTLRQTTAEVPQENPAFGADVRKGNVFNTQPANTTIRQTTAETAQENPAFGADNRRGNLFNTQPANNTLRQTTAETAQDNGAYGPDNRRGNIFNTQPANSTIKQLTIDVPQENPAHGPDNRRGNLFNTQPANSTIKQLTIDVPQNNPAHGPDNKKVQLYNKQPAMATLRQEVNYNDHINGTHTVVEEHRSRSDVNAMTTHSHKEETLESRLFTYSGWNAGITKENIGQQNSKERDKYLNYTRVNPPNSITRNGGVQDMGVGSNLDDRIVMQLNKLKQMPFQNDRIEKGVAEILQNNQLINNALQKYKEPNLAY